MTEQDRIHMRSERPAEAIVKRKRFFFRINRLLANIYNFFFRQGLRYRALGAAESLDLLLATKKSLIRYGNGESEIMVGLDMATQEYDPALRKVLIEIIRNYSPKSNYLLSLTNWNLTQSVKQLKASPRKQKFRLWRYMRFVFWKLGMGNIAMPFLETDMFRAGEVGLGLKDIEQLWEDKSTIIVVHNNEDYFRWFRDAYPEKAMHFVKIPDKNFFPVCGEIEGEILNVIRECGISRDHTVILVSAGPGANVLCYYLCQKHADYRCYDMGNFFHMHYRESRPQ